MGQVEAGDARSWGVSVSGLRSLRGRAASLGALQIAFFLLVAVALLLAVMAAWNSIAGSTSQFGKNGAEADFRKLPNRHPLDVLGRNAAAQNAERESCPFLLGRTPHSAVSADTPSVRGKDCLTPWTTARHEHLPVMIPCWAQHAFLLDH